MSKKGFDGLMRRSCTSVLVGRAATRDGSILIARNEDNTTPAAPKSLRMVPAGERDGVELVSGANGFVITLPEGGLRYSAMPDVTPEEGLFEEAGVNAAHVAMSATESALANDRVLAFDPYVENGLAEDAMLTVVLPYVKTAREGVKRLGEIVAAHGSAESNGVLFADHLEAWYMEIATGHHWVAQRIPDDCVAVVANQLSIQEVDFESDSFMYSEGIREFVEEHALNSALGGGGEHPFNFREIFGTSSDGDRRYNTPRVWDGLRLLAPEIAKEHTVARSLPRACGRPRYGRCCGAIELRIPEYAAEQKRREVEREVKRRKIPVIVESSEDDSSDEVLFTYQAAPAGTSTQALNEAKEAALAAIDEELARNISLGQAFVHDASRCTQCGLCYMSCPEENIGGWAEITTRELPAKVEHDLAVQLCEKCGRPFKPKADETKCTACSRVSFL